MDIRFRDTGHIEVLFCYKIHNAFVLDASSLISHSFDINEAQSKYVFSFLS